MHNPRIHLTKLLLLAHLALTFHLAAANADLQLLSVEFAPQQVNAGASLSNVSWFLLNNGPDTLVRPTFQFDFFLSRNSTPGDADDVKVDSASIPNPLFNWPAGATAKQTVFGVAVPTNAAGAYHLVARVAPIGTDSNLANNASASVATLNVLGRGFPLFNVTKQGNVFTVSLATATNQTYVLEYKPTLDAPVWTPRAAITGNGTTRQLTDSRGTSAQGFYRVVAAIQPQDSFHAGDVYLTTAGENRLLRSGRAVAVRSITNNQITAVVQSLTTANGALSGFQTVFARSNFAIVSLPTNASALTLERLQQSLATASTATGVEVVDPVFMDTQSGLLFATTDEIIVCLKAGVDPETYFGANWPNVRPVRGTTRQFILRQPKANSTQVLGLAVTHALNPAADWAEPNFILQASLLAAPPNDPLFAEQWHLNNTGQLGGVPNADVNGLEAWDISRGAGITIAVLDDGFDLGHPDLAPNLFRNSGEIPGNNRDDDNNGFVDDVNGWDFANAWFFFGIVIPFPDDNDPSPDYDEENHGTSVAGVAAARGGNATGVSGVAPESRFLPLKLLLYGGNGVFVTADKYATAIYYAAGRSADGNGRWPGADIMNMSFGIASPDFRDEGMAAIDTALTWAATQGRNGKGTVLMAAAGNEGTNRVLFPASHPSVIAVGASTDRDVLSAYSSTGSKVDFVASSGPWSSKGQVGARIRTTDRRGNKGYNTNAAPAGDYTPDFGGTSSASPLAAGVAALLLSAKPELSSEEVRTVLRETADKIGPLPYVNGRNDEYGFGRINAFAALQRVTGSQPPTVTSFSPASGLVGTTVTITGTRFTGATSVAFNGINAAQFTVNSDTQITATVPASATSGPISVTTRSGTATSATAFTVVQNQLPTVTLTGPVNGATFTAPATITLTANASDGDGTISQVEFLANGNIIGSDTTSPYGFVWTNVAAGSYALAARATDNRGATVTSTSVNVTVNPVGTPTITHTGPAQYTPGGTVEITNMFTYSGTLLSLGWQPQLPSGWQLLSVVGNGGSPEINPQRTGIVWTGTLPPSPIQMRYTVQVPVSTTGAAQIRGRVDYQLQGTVNPAAAFAAPDPLVLSSAPPPPAGRFQFAFASTNVSESGSSVRLSVLRVVGSSGAVAVQFRIDPGTAQPLQDYSPQIGRLIWADADASVREITIELRPDSLPETNEIFSVVLHSPESGAVLGDPATAVVTIVDDDQPRPMANPQSVITLEDASVNITLTGSDPNNRALTFAVGTPPTKGTLSPTPPNLTYTPRLNENGADSFTFTASNGLAVSTPATVSINITPVNDAPTLNVIPNQTISGPITVTLSGISSGATNENQTLTVTATSSNPTLLPNPVVSYTNSNATGTLTLTPATNQTGTVTITVRVQDNGGTANGGQDTITRTFDVTVTSPSNCLSGPNICSSHDQAGISLRSSVSAPPYDRLAQGIRVPVSGSYRSAQLALDRFGSPNGNVWVAIETDNAGKPSGISVANGISLRVSALQVPVEGLPPVVTFSFAQPVSLLAGIRYWLVLYCDYAFSTQNVRWRRSFAGTGTYPDGDHLVFDGTNWFSQEVQPTDFGFCLFPCAPPVCSPHDQAGISLRSSVSAPPYDRLAQGIRVAVTTSYRSAQLAVDRFGTPTGNVWVAIETDAGNRPSGVAVPNGTSLRISALQVPVEGQTPAATFTFEQPVSLLSGTSYWLVLYCDYPFSPQNVRWRRSFAGTGTYPDGDHLVFDGTNWFAQEIQPTDFGFCLFP